MSRVIRFVIAVGTLLVGLFGVARIYAPFHGRVECALGKSTCSGLRQELQIANRCSLPVWIAIRYRGEDGRWHVTAYAVAAQAEGTIEDESGRPRGFVGSEVRYVTGLLFEGFQLRAQLQPMTPPHLDDVRLDRAVRLFESLRDHVFAKTITINCQENRHAEAH